MMKKYISMIAASMMLVSCLDTIILPDDKTVDEDFWQNKAEVSSMVNAAYSAMASNDVVADIFVWGDFRSDEMTLGTSAASTAVYDALNEIATLNIQTTNRYAAWSSLYSVINRCNIVLARAGAVRDIDPNYTQGDYDAHRSQMLALRALCYFYLVRAYRDVPYITDAYMTSSQNTQVAQSTPAYVLERCIADLEEAAKYPILASGFTTNEWQRVGWLTNDGINALLADIYLWRAAVTHSAADYQRCIDYCDLVITSKQSQHDNRFDVETKNYPLASAGAAYTSLFVNQNAEESIFELQLRGNLTVEQFLYKYANNSSGEGFLKATPMFNSAASKVVNVSATQVFSTNDLRYYASCYGVGGGDGNLDIRKMIGNSSVTELKSQPRDAIDYASGGLDRNHIIYRLSDVMLMKAEALVELVDTNQTAAELQAQLRVPFTLVQEVNTRSLYSENLADSMTWDTPCNYKNYSKEQMEELVMKERMRELCFEGKRWFDLLRYNYRHTDYSADQYNTLLVDLHETNRLGTIYTGMKTLIVNASGSDGTAVAAKMQNEAYLYMPVPNSDIIVCKLLKQNPVYKSGNAFEKSY